MRTIENITNIEKRLKMEQIRQLFNERKVSFFKTLAISEIVHLRLIKEVPSSLIA